MSFLLSIRCLQSFFLTVAHLATNWGHFAALPSLCLLWPRCVGVGGNRVCMSTVTKKIWTENHHLQFPRFLWHPDFPLQSSQQIVFALCCKHHLTVEKMYWWEFTKSLKLVFFVFPFCTIYSHFVVSSMFKTNIFEGQVRVWGPKFYLILVCGSGRSQSSYLRCFKRGLGEPLSWWHPSPFFVLATSDLL